MPVSDHIAAIDDALDNFAEDSTISLADYAEAMEELASRVKMSALAAQTDLPAQTDLLYGRG